MQRRKVRRANGGVRGRRKGKNEDDKWITVSGSGKTKKIPRPKLAPKLHNAFAILFKPNTPTIYNMSGPALQMDDDKTIIPPNPLEHCRQRKIAQRQHIKQTLRRLRDSDDMFLNNSITRAEDERTILDKDSTIWQSTLPTSSVAQQALVLPNGATMPPTVWAQHSTGR